MSEIEEALDEFVKRVEVAAGENLESIVLYGSAARSDFNERYSDLNLLVVVRETHGKELDNLASVMTWWTRKRGQRPPLVVTEEELRTSADVFAIETLDVKASHRILSGRDVLEAIEVPMNLHRVQLEHELRTVLLKLRQNYLLARENEAVLQDVVAKSVSSVVTLFRHALIALGYEVPGSKREVVAQIAKLDKIEAAPLDAALDLREGRRIDTGVDTLYHQYMEAISALIRHVDKIVPKEQWQRTATSSPERIE